MVLLVLIYVIFVAPHSLAISMWTFARKKAPNAYIFRNLAFFVGVARAQV